MFQLYTKVLIHLFYYECYPIRIVLILYTMNRGLPPFRLSYLRDTSAYFSHCQKHSKDHSCYHLPVAKTTLAVKRISCIAVGVTLRQRLLLQVDFLKTTLTNGSISDEPIVKTRRPIKGRKFTLRTSIVPTIYSESDHSVSTEADSEIC